MARRTIPVVEVTDPDGIKSFWVAYAIPHDRAVAAVQDRLPPGHTAELAGRRPPDSRKLKGARKGDIIKCWGRGIWHTTSLSVSIYS